MFNKAYRLTWWRNWSSFCPFNVLWFPNESHKIVDKAKTVKERRNLHTNPLAYQLQLLFMEFQVTVDKMEKEKGESCKRWKVNEVKGFVFIAPTRSDEH